VRELEFLPEWYPMLHRRKRWVKIQAWLTVVVMGGLGLYMFLLARNVNADEASLANLKGQISQTDAQLQKLHEWQTLRQELSHQAKIVGQLGPHVPAARLLDSLDDLLGPQMGLLDLSIETQKPQKPAGGLALAGGAPPAVDRKLSVKLRGVAPSGIEVGNFLARLASVRCFSNIDPSYSRDRVVGTRLMRAFEVKFTIDLNGDR